MDSFSSLSHIISEQCGSEVVGKDTKIESLELDSLDCVEIVMEIEDDLNIKLEIGQILQCDTIGDLVCLIDSIPKVAAKPWWRRLLWT